MLQLIHLAIPGPLAVLVVEVHKPAVLPHPDRIAPACQGPGPECRRTTESSTVIYRVDRSPGEIMMTRDFHVARRAQLMASLTSIPLQIAMTPFRYVVSLLPVERMMAMQMRRLGTRCQDKGRYECDIHEAEKKDEHQRNLLVFWAS